MERVKPKFRIGDLVCYNPIGSDKFDAIVIETIWDEFFIEYSYIIMSLDNKKTRLINYNDLPWLKDFKTI